MNIRHINLPQMIEGNYVMQIVTKRNVYTRNLVIVTK